jgi:methylated-DNA-[protein]-cysteine S-methyltransferase
MNFKRQTIESPIGTLSLFEKDGAIEGIIFQSLWRQFRMRFKDYEDIETPVLKEAKRQLREYFAGKRQDFDLPLKLTGTPFQNKVWSALKRIPFGKTRTYKEQAVLIQSPKAVRAVGQTHGRNPLCVVLPCHRVIGANGTLTGYAGGLPAKQFLLKLEKTLVESA